MAFAFEKLLVYQKAIDFSDAVCAKSENFARGYGFLTDQLNRAALSIAANIAEGNGRFTKPDRKIFLNRTWFGAGICAALGTGSAPRLGDADRSRSPKVTARRDRQNAERIDQWFRQPGNMTHRQSGFLVTLASFTSHSWSLDRDQNPRTQRASFPAQPQSRRAETARDFRRRTLGRCFADEQRLARELPPLGETVDRASDRLGTAPA
jgi:hypothetical protein